MTNALQPFMHPEFGEIRIVDQNGEPWFIARDVALRLGYKNPAKAIKDHCKKVNKITQENAAVSHHVPPTNYLVIPESDVYRLVMRSELPNAAKFQDWLYEEVLPSLRKTGSYGILKGIPKNHLDYIQSTQFTIAALTALEEEREKNVVLEERVDDLTTRLGENENWKRAAAIPWLKHYFDMSKVPGVYQAIGKELTKISRLMGVEKKYAKSFQYPHPIGVYNLEVVEALREELELDGDLLKEYRRPKLRRRRNNSKQKLRLVA